jgi:hypothetical protein
VRVLAGLVRPGRAALERDPVSVRLGNHEVGETVAVEVAHPVAPLEDELRIARLPQELALEDALRARLGSAPDERPARVQEQQLVAAAGAHVGAGVGDDVGGERDRLAARERTARPLPPRLDAAPGTLRGLVQRQQDLDPPVAVQVGQRGAVGFPAVLEPQRLDVSELLRGSRQREQSDHRADHRGRLSSRSASPPAKRSSHRRRRRQAAGVRS